MKRASLFLAAIPLVALSARAQSSLVPFTTTVTLYDCPGGLREIVPINSAVPTSFKIAGTTGGWLDLDYPPHLAGVDPKTPTWIAFFEEGLPPGPPVDDTLTPADGTAPVVIHVSWDPKPTCNPSGNSNGTVTVTPPALFLDPLGSVGSQPLPLTVQTSSGSPVPFSVAVTAPWLYVGSVTSYFTSNSAPAKLGIGSNQPAITSSASVIITPLGQPPIYIPVLQVAGFPDSPGGPYADVSQLVFHAPWNGSPPPSQNLPVRGLYPNFAATAEVLDSSVNWLSVTPGIGQDQTVSVNQTGLAVGVYQGRVSLTRSGITVYSLVTLFVDNPTSNVTVAPASLSFGYGLGQPPPASQKVTITGTGLFGGPLGFTAATAADAGGTWLSTNPPAGTGVTPASFTVTVNPAGLGIGVHRGSITLQPGGAAAVQIPVVVTVRAAPSLTITPANPSKQITSGDPFCAQQPNLCEGGVLVSSGNGADIDFTAQAISTGSWLSVSPASGTIPGFSPLSLTFAVDPSLNAGTYTGTLRVTAVNDASISASVTVTATVLPPQPSFTILNAASYARASFSPGEIVAFIGDHLGPDTPVTAQPDQNGAYPRSLGGISIEYVDAAMPLLYVSRTQVNAIVPYDACKGADCISMSYPPILLFKNQQGAGTFEFAVAPSGSDPGIFTLDGSGRGQGAILNQDYSVNGPANSAAKGTVVQLFMTGEGQTSPPGVDGQVTAISVAPPITPTPLLGVTASIDGRPATVMFAGEAAGLVAGVLQVNIEIPGDARSGSLPIQVSIGGKTSQAGVIVSVQ